MQDKPYTHCTLSSHCANMTTHTGTYL